MIIERFGKTLVSLLGGIICKLYAFSTNENEKLRKQCEGVKFKFFVKSQDFLQSLRHMADSDESLSRASDDDLFEDVNETAERSSA